MSQRTVYNCDLCGKEIADAGDEMFHVSVNRYVADNVGKFHLADVRGSELCGECARALVSAKLR